MSGAPGHLVYAGRVVAGGEPQSAKGGHVVGGMAGREVEGEFAAFVTAHYARLLHVADLLTGDRDRAEDLLQGVLIRTYLRWSKVRQNNPFGYVRAGLANARTDWWRRRSSRECPLAVPPDPAAEPDHAVLVAGRDAVQRALARLTARERAVVVLRFYEDLSEAEIGAALRIAPGTVKSTCARALTKLRISPDLATPRLAPTDRPAPDLLPPDRPAPDLLPPDRPAPHLLPPDRRAPDLARKEQP